MLSMLCTAKMANGNVVEVDLSEWKFIQNDQADCGMYTVQKKTSHLKTLCNFVKC